jgi:hypothetical protein
LSTINLSQFIVFLKFTHGAWTDSKKKRLLMFFRHRPARETDDREQDFPITGKGVSQVKKNGDCSTTKIFSSSYGRKTEICT